MAAAAAAEAAEESRERHRAILWRATRGRELMDSAREGKAST